MTTVERVSAFCKLGERLKNLNEQDADFYAILQRAQHKNPWFTEGTIILYVQAIGSFLTKENVQVVADSVANESEAKNIAITVTNAVSPDWFVDCACVILAGHNVQLKLSEGSGIFPMFLIKTLIEAEPSFAKQITICNGPIQHFDAIIADTTNDFYERYFSAYPHLFKHRQTSIAILDGNESVEDLQRLGLDMFEYFGLDRRNVTKIFLPETMQEAKLLDALEPFNKLTMHYKYMNNYEYNKSIYLVSKEKHFDNGFLIFKEDKKLNPPMAVVFYEKYTDADALTALLEKEKQTIKNIVAPESFLPERSVTFGESHHLCITDFEETIHFIKNI